MKRLRAIKRYAGVWIIKLFTVDIVDLGLKEGDMVDISQLKKEGNKK